MIITVRGFNIIVDDDFIHPGPYIGIDQRGYARIHRFLGNGKYSYLFLHRYITNAPDGMVVDHINHMPLDNRRANLRICTRSQNAANRVVRQGYCFNKAVGKFQVVICHQRKNRYVGLFDTAEEAAAAYSRENIRLRGEFAAQLQPAVA